MVVLVVRRGRQRGVLDVSHPVGVLLYIMSDNLNLIHY